MRNKLLPKTRKIIYFLIFLLLIFIVAIAAYKHEEIACKLIAYSKFDEIEKDVYVSSDTSEMQKDELRKLIIDAENRLRKKFGSYSALPIIIASHDMAKLKYYTKNSYASTQFNLNKACIVLGPNGHNIDIVSHEMAHAELFQRIGYINRSLKIPVWFDEGIAMQVDYREKYDNLPKNPKKLTQLRYSWQFYSGDISGNYAIAKSELGEWLNGSGNQAFYELLAGINDGASFKSLYHLNKIKR